MDPIEKIQLDDITFDDVIAGDGVATTPIDATPAVPDGTADDDLKIAANKEAADLAAAEAAAAANPDADGEGDGDGDDDDDDDDDPTIVSEVLSTLGYELDGEYEDTADGLAKMTKDVADKMADTRIDEVLENFPEVKKHLEYVLAGGESDNFMKAHESKSDYSKMTLSEDDSRTQKEILSNYFSTKGHDKEFIDEMLEDYEDSGKLFGKAEQARQALGKHQDEKKAQLVVNQRKAFDDQAAEQAKFWDGVSETIESSTEFAGLVVPDKEKAKFFKYISSPVNKQGQSQRDVDHSEAEMETKLAMDYLMYKGFNLESIINTKAKTKSTQSLREKIAKNTDTVKAARKAQKNKKVFDVDDVDFEL
jgi:hypothetical protein